MKRISCLLVLSLLIGCGGGGGGGSATPTTPPPSQNQSPIIGGSTSPTTGITNTTMFHYVISPSDPDGDAVLVRIDFDGDGTWDVPYGIATEYDQVYPVAGTYPARVQAKDSKGAESAVSILTAVVVNDPDPSNIPPVVSGTVSPFFGIKGVTGFHYTLTPSDPDGDATTVRIDFEGDGVWDTAYGAQTNFDKVFPAADTYIAKAQAKDSRGAESPVVTLTSIVVNEPPAGNNPPNITGTVSPNSGIKDSTNFHYVLSPSDPDGDATTVKIDYEGDGVWDTSYGTQTAFDKIFSTSGTYTGKIQARDSKGSESAVQNLLSITVNDPTQTNHPPTTTTTAADTITISSAVLKGDVNPNGLATTAWFEHGQDSSLTTFTTTPSQPIGSGMTPVSIAQSISGLFAGNTYYYRVAASNSPGTNKGSILSFTTTNSNTPPEVAYLEISPERVLRPTTTGTITLTLNDPADIDRVEIAFTTGDFTPLTKVDEYRWSVVVDATKLLQNYISGEPRVFVGYLDTYKGTTRTTRYNLFLMVRSSAMPDVSVQSLGSDRQASNHVLNLRHDVLFLGGTTSTFSTVWNAIQPTVQSAIGQRDFNALVGQVEAFANRTGGSVLAFPNAGFFDLANMGAVHEIGHRWLAYSNHPLINGDPHWAVGNAADGIMGWSLPPSNQGVMFPYHIAPGSAPGTTQLWSVTTATDFNELELYKTGILPKAQVSPILQFTDQARIKAWLMSPYSLPSCGNGCQVIDIPSAYVTIDEIIAADGPTPPAAQTSFTLGTTVLSAGRLLTANEMAYFEYMAARGEGTAPVEVWEGFSHYISKPFGPATGDRMTLSTRIR